MRWLGAFAVAMSYTWLDSLQNWVFFAVEAGIVGLIVLFAYWTLGETRGRSLEYVRMTHSPTSIDGTQVKRSCCIGFIPHDCLCACVPLSIAIAVGQPWDCIPKTSLSWLIFQVQLVVILTFIAIGGTHRLSNKSELAFHNATCLRWCTPMLRPLVH